MEGIFTDMPDAIYRRASGVSQSALKELARSPAHYQAALRQPDEPTPAMVFGRIAHHALLTPNEPPTWAVRPEGLDGRTRDGKAWAEANAGKEIIPHDVWQSIQAAIASAANHPTIRLAMMDAAREVSVFMRHGETLRKGRIDLVPDGPALCDFKFVDDGREESFARQVWSLKYYLQAAYYLDLYNDARTGGERKNVFLFFAVEKEPPFAVSVFELAPSAIERGRDEYHALLDRLAECERSGEWPAYPLNVQMLDLPRWTRTRDPIFG